MRSSKQVLFFFAAFILLAIAKPSTLLASDTQIIVNNAPGAACSTSATPACFTTIQSAIDHANENNITSSSTGTVATFSIQVEAGQYSENITLGIGITSLRGRETAKTILNGGGNGILITVSGGNPIISNFTFLSAQSGVALTNNATATINNNIFNLGQSGTAVQLTQSSAITSITNNTFYQNNVAISGSIAVQIKNNIFLSNSSVPAVPANATTSSLVAYNDFFDNTANPLNEPGDNAGNISGDPKFVDKDNGDFHLQAGSPCIGSGSSSSDLGAYGGTDTDTIPFQVAGLTAAQTSATSITVNWTKNLDHKVTGYRVWYGRTSLNYIGTTGATEGASPVSVPTGTSDSTFTLNGLTTTVIAPAKPALSPDRVTTLNEGLVLSWDAVPGATGYKVYSDIDDGTLSPPTTLKDTINTTSDTISYTLGDLTNDVKYKIAVSAIAQSIYYIAVTAVYSNTGLTPGVSNESIYSVEQSVGTGEIKESPISNIVSDYPEAVVAYPNLQNSRHGCFIATAAYGYYSAPEVQALRTFRDRYLLTNSAGSMFVRWYYEHGPVAAAWLDAHPGYKPVVRTALMPAVGLAFFMTGSSMVIKAVAALFIVIIAFMIAYRFSRKRLTGSGGAQ